MYRIPILIFLLGMASLASGSTPTADHPTGDHPRAWGDRAVDGREGGENLDSAVPEPGLPFTDTGATCDNFNDYDEVCPFTGSTSPDVVYVSRIEFQEVTAGNA
jgi:hypothetical protein